MEYLKGSDNFSPLLRSHFSDCSTHSSVNSTTVTVAKRFCADFAPSPEADIAKFTAMVTDTQNSIILLKKSERNSIGVFAQKSFEVDDVITECVDTNEDMDNTVPR